MELAKLTEQIKDSEDKKLLMKVRIARIEEEVTQGISNVSTKTPFGGYIAEAVRRRDKIQKDAVCRACKKRQHVMRGCWK